MSDDKGLVEKILAHARSTPNLDGPMGKLAVWAIDAETALREAASALTELEGALREIEVLCEPLNEARYSGNALNHIRALARAALAKLEAER